MMQYSRQRCSLVVMAILCLRLVDLFDQTQAINKPTLEALCNDKQLSLTKISTTRQLIAENRVANQTSCAKYADSLEHLDDILTTVQTGKICDLALVDKIRKYHESFLVNSNKNSRKIPEPLRFFFIALCFQISAECKMALINNLELDTKDKLTDADYDEIRFLEAHGATLLDQDTKITDFDDVLLISDLSDAAGLEAEMGESKLLIKARTNKMMRKLIENCNKKFKPFYDKLILPLIRLSNLGYNYRGKLLEREMQELQQNTLVLRWYNIVQTCEAFLSIEIYEDPDPPKLSEDLQPITFISREMANSLRKRNVKTIEEEIQESEAEEGPEPENVYNPIAWHNEDELWIKDQKELEELVHKHKASVTESERIKSRLFKKIVSNMKEMIFSGQIPGLVSELVKNGFGGGDVKETPSFNDELVMMIDEAVREDEIKSGNPPARGRDGRVAGPRKIVSRASYSSMDRANMDVPPRAKFVPFVKDGTKTTKKLFRFGQKFLPSRIGILTWILLIMAMLILISHAFMGR